MKQKCLNTKHKGMKVVHLRQPVVHIIYGRFVHKEENSFNVFIKLNGWTILRFWFPTVILFFK